MKTHVPIMRPRDADIPKGLQGDLTLVIADLGGARVVFRHPMEDAGINDPQFQTLPVLVRIQGLSDQAADDIAAMLDDYPGHLPLPPRSDLFGSLPHTV